MYLPVALHLYNTAFAISLHGQCNFFPQIIKIIAPRLCVGGALSPTADPIAQALQLCSGFKAC